MRNSDDCTPLKISPVKHDVFCRKISLSLSLSLSLKIRGTQQLQSNSSSGFYLTIHKESQQRWMERTERSQLHQQGVTPGSPNRVASSIFLLVGFSFPCLALHFFAWKYLRFVQDHIFSLSCYVLICENFLSINIIPPFCLLEFHWFTSVGFFFFKKMWDFQLDLTPWGNGVSCIWYCIGSLLLLKIQQYLFILLPSVSCSFLFYLFCGFVWFLLQKKWMSEFDGRIVYLAYALILWEVLMYDKNFQGCLENFWWLSWWDQWRGLIRPFNLHLLIFVVLPMVHPLHHQGLNLEMEGIWPIKNMASQKIRPSIRLSMFMALILADMMHCHSLRYLSFSLTYIYWCKWWHSWLLVWFEFQKVAEELGVYFVSFDRAGYGESDPNPKRTVKSTPLDIEELADQLELGSKFYVIGFSMGGQIVWSCLKYIPHRYDLDLCFCKSKAKRADKLTQTCLGQFRG